VSLTQLALDIGLRDDATFNSYCKVNNEMAYACVVSMAQGQGEQFTYLWGKAGVGKTHLLQAACHLASDNELPSVYLPLDSVAVTVDIDKLQGLENINLICLDNVQAIATKSKWEEELFHLFNNIKAKQHKLLITADKPPTQLNLNLSDLKSRLSWGVVYQLHDLEDEAKLMVLQSRAKSRGLELDHAVGRFLLRRCSRNMAYLFTMLEHLDKASLAQQRKLTVPFVKQILDI
jgi:DnaA family protein